VGGGPFVGFERLGEGLLDAGAEHLDRDLRPSVVTARWTWAMEAAPTGHFVELAEQLSSGASSACSTPCGSAERARAEASPEARKRLCAAFLADEVGAGGERLAELDRGGAELLQRGGIVGLGRLARPKRARRARRRKGRGEGIALDPLQRAVAGKRAAPAQQR
jgi:hypothetical protein